MSTGHMKGLTQHAIGPYSRGDVLTPRLEPIRCLNATGREIPESHFVAVIETADGPQIMRDLGPGSVSGD